MEEAEKGGKEVADKGKYLENVALPFSGIVQHGGG